MSGVELNVTNSDECCRDGGTMVSKKTSCTPRVLPPVDTHLPSLFLTVKWTMLEQGTVGASGTRSMVPGCCKHDTSVLYVQAYTNQKSI